MKMRVLKFPAAVVGILLGIRLGSGTAWSAIGSAQFPPTLNQRQTPPRTMGSIDYLVITGNTASMLLAGDWPGE